MYYSYKFNTLLSMTHIYYLTTTPPPHSPHPTLSPQPLRSSSNSPPWECRMWRCPLFATPCCKLHDFAALTPRPLPAYATTMTPTSAALHSFTIETGSTRAIWPANTTTTPPRVTILWTSIGSLLHLANPCSSSIISVSLLPHTHIYMSYCHVF